LILAPLAIMPAIGGLAADRATGNGHGAAARHGIERLARGS
jgi:hypothetical protein